MQNENSMDWPFASRRYPKLDDPDYLGSKGLSVALRKAIEAELGGKGNLDILDVGCGWKPFYPFLKPFARSYTGIDIIDNSVVDKVCSAEHIDLKDESADVVLCLSVMEHVDDPNQVARELFRVLRPNGVVFASTHGCFPWHPFPQDHWRWTQTGLLLQFEKHGGFRSVRLFATRGTVSGIFFLLAHYVYAWTSKRRWRLVLRRPLTSFVNITGEILDKMTPSLKDVHTPITAIPEFFVVAKKN